MDKKYYRDNDFYVPTTKNVFLVMKFEIICSCRTCIDSISIDKVSVHAYLFGLF